MKIKPLEGYRIIRHGTIQEDDLIYDIITKSWTAPGPLLGDEVPSNGIVSRRIPGAITKEKYHHLMDITERLITLCNNYAKNERNPMKDHVLSTLEKEFDNLKERK